MEREAHGHQNKPGPLNFGHGASYVNRSSACDERGGCSGCDNLEYYVVIEYNCLWVNPAV